MRVIAIWSYFYTLSLFHTQYYFHSDFTCGIIALDNRFVKMSDGVVKMSGLETATKLNEQSVLNKEAIVLAATLVGDTWLLLIINELLDGTKRFGQIQEGLQKITAQTLSGRLKTLEHCGMVTRYSYNEIPPRV